MKRHVLVLLVFLGTLSVASAFSLLGPFRNLANGASDPWQGTNYGGRAGGLGYSLPGDIGGPMFLNEGYRWNLPVLTYGFDPSFTEYFGEEGVAEVEKAIAILNDLPPASEFETALNGIPLDTKSQNASAEVLGLLDLKSHAMALLVEQLGLAAPERFVWSLRDRQTSGTTTNYTVIGLNFDPQTLAPSPWVNGVAYEYKIFDVWGGGEWATAAEWYHLDPLYQPYSSVAGELGSRDIRLAYSPYDVGFFGSGLQPGHYFTGLTRDDIGGMAYLLSRDNTAVESLPAGVFATGPNPTNFINTALRPGVEKIVFQRQHYSTADESFRRMTNVFEDVYLADGSAKTQTLTRIVTTPDFLFSAKAIGGTIHDFGEETYFSPHRYRRSDTARWINNAELNGRPGGGGPGVIQPPVEITFNRLGRYGFQTGGGIGMNLWGAFDGTPAEVRPFFGSETNIATETLRTRLVMTNGVPQLEWTFLKASHRRNQIEVSTNLTDWTPLMTIEPYSDFSNAATVRDPVGVVPRFYRNRITEWNP